MSRVLIIGAMGAETLPLLSALRHRRPLTPRLVTGTLDGQPVAVLTCGVGPAKAARRSSRALRHIQVRAVVSVGTCGALVDDLSVGDVVTAERLLQEEAQLPAPLPWPDALAVTIVTVSKPVWSPDRRAALAAAGAAVCEMEAAAIQSIIENLPFSALKVVSDLAGGSSDDPPSRAGPADIARFRASASRLCREHLLPVLREGLCAL